MKCWSVFSKNVKIPSLTPSLPPHPHTQVYGGFVLHLGEVTKGTFSPSQAVTAKVNYDRRSPIAANHTLTHVLNYGLRSVLVGDDFGKEGAPTIDQKGSLCDDTKLRFDFSWNGPISVDQVSEHTKLT